MPGHIPANGHTIALVDGVEQRVHARVWHRVNIQLALLSVKRKTEFVSAEGERHKARVTGKADRQDRQEGKAGTEVSKPERGD